MPRASAIQQYLNDRIDSWAREHVYDEAVRFAQAANMPPQFIRGIRLVRRRAPRSSQRTTYTRQAHTRTITTKSGKTRAHRREYRVPLTTATIHYEYELVNGWHSKDHLDQRKNIPLARYFEYGTKNHFIFPRRAEKLAWKSRDLEQPTNVNYKWRKRDPRTPEGGWIFSSGHEVSGLPRILAMTRGVREGTAALRTRIRNEMAAVGAYG